MTHACLLAIALAACGGGTAQPAGGAQAAAGSSAGSAGPPAVACDSVRAKVEGLYRAIAQHQGALGGAVQQGAVMADDDEGASQFVTKGTATVSVNLKPGTYTFFCEAPGHRQAGMYGTLTVK